ELNSADHEQDRVLEQQAEKRSRLNLLEQLQAEHEGFSAGSLAALKQSSQVLGSLADSIRVPDQYVTAIETALGHHLQLVLTEQPEAAHQILIDLNQNKSGRASVAPLAFLRNGHPNPESNETASEKASETLETDAHDPSVDGEETNDPDWQGALAASTCELNGEPLAAIAVVQS